MGAGGGDGIRVHAGNANAGIELPQLLLYPLRTRAEKAERAAAGGAAAVQRAGIAAVVAHHAAVGGMIGQIRAAVGAAQRVPTFRTGHHGAAAPTIQKEDGLLPRLEILFQFLRQYGADAARRPGLQFLRRASI